MTDRSPAHRPPDFHLFLSPHLDDAVLSCGGQIYDLVQRGHTAAIYTVMAGKPPRTLPSSPILQDLHTRWEAGPAPIETRRREDIRALRSLGALARHATIPDCVYRVRYVPGGEPVAIYPDEESLWGTIRAADTALLLLESMPLPYPTATVLHVPLGAGRHVDHLLVRDWGRRLARAYPRLTVLYYEEYPYSRTPGAVEAAMAAFEPTAPDFEPVLYPLDDAALDAKIAAIAAYKSQISTFWRDTESMVCAIREDAQHTGGDRPAEREWRPRP